MITVFNKGDLITADGLNRVNRASNSFGENNWPSEYDAAWWPAPGNQANKMWLSGDRYYRIATWDRKAGGDNSGASTAPPSKWPGWHWFPSKGGMYLYGGAKAFFRYWYQKNIWTNGGGWRYLIEKKENGSWVTFATGGEDNREGGIDKAVDIPYEGWYRMAIATEPTAYAADGSAGVLPFKSDCARGDFLRSTQPYVHGRFFNQGRPLTASELNSGRVITQKYL